MLPLPFDQLAFSNLSEINRDVRGVVLCFHGMGQPPMLDELDENQRDLARHGIAWVYPYCGPWSWMNRETVCFVDAVVDHVWERCGLSDATPLVTTGCSMGGFAALVYARDGARRVTACVANCPATDLSALCAKRPDVPRAVAYAHRGEAETLEVWMRQHSPLYTVDALPRIPYLIVHGDADQDVLKELHGDPMAHALRTAGRDVTYLEVPGMPHCGPLPEEVLAKIHAFVVHAAEPSGTIDLVSP